jgi:hypothetical protein
VRPEWRGPIELRIWARDSAGQESAAVVSYPDSLEVYPTVERLQRTAYVQHAVSQVYVDTLRRQVILLQRSEQAILAVSTATGTVTATVPLPDYPIQFDGSAGGDSLIVLLSGLRALGIVDLRDLSLPPSLIPMPAIDPGSAWHLAAAANGKVFVSMSGNAPADYRLFEVDLVTGAQRFRTDAGDSGAVGAGMLSSSPDHAVVVVGDYGIAQRYEASTDRFGPRLVTTAASAPLHFDRAGALFALRLGVYDGSSFRLVRTVRSPNPYAVTAATLSPDGADVYFTVPQRGLLRSRVSDGALLDRSWLYSYADDLWAATDGSILVAIHPGGFVVSIIDLR